MAGQLDWSIFGKDPAVDKTVVPNGTRHTYDLFNLTDSNTLVYGHRPGNNINLRWGDPDQSDNIRFLRQSGSSEPIRYGELLAIHVRGGDFLVYQRGRWGINLGWSDKPKFEWKILGGTEGQVVPTFRPVGLYSMVERDYLIYEPRDSGINLKWFKDSGKYQELQDALRAGKTAVEIGKTIASIFG
jgi:hypothetical protein